MSTCQSFQALGQHLITSVRIWFRINNNVVTQYIIRILQAGGLTGLWCFQHQISSIRTITSEKYCPCEHHRRPSHSTKLKAPDINLQQLQVHRYLVVISYWIVTSWVASNKNITQHSWRSYCLLKNWDDLTPMINQQWQSGYTNI